MLTASRPEQHRHKRTMPTSTSTHPHTLDVGYRQRHSRVAVTPCSWRGPVFTFLCAGVVLVDNPACAAKPVQAMVQEPSVLHLHVCDVGECPLCFCVCVCVHMHICVCVCVCVCMCMQAHACVCMRLYICAWGVIFLFAPWYVWTSHQEPEQEPTDWLVFSQA
jgi:hypothetical protein